MKKVFAAAATCLLSMNMMANGDKAEGKGKWIEVNMNMLSYDSLSAKVKTGGASATTTTTSIETPNDLELVLDAGKMTRWYLYPTDPTMGFGLGFRVMPKVEVGANLRYKSESVDKPSKHTDNMMNIGLFANYDMEVGKSLVTAKLMVESSSSKTESTSPKEEHTGSAFGLGVELEHPLCETVSYLGGVHYMMMSDKEKKSDVKAEMADLEIHLLGVRMHF